MIIRKFKKKALITSVGLIIIGSLITLTGFSINKFGLNKFKENDTHRWYRTIHVEDRGCSFTIGS